MVSAEYIGTPTSNSAEGRWLILATATVATGVAAGLGGMVLGLLLHFIQHVAYGYSLHAIASHESFLEGVSASSPVRRFVVLCVCGVVAGTGFWNHAWPGVPLAAFAIVGSAAFLASSMKMPLTAVVLVMEFTRVGHDFLIPMLFGVIGSVSVFYLCTQHVLQPAWRTHHDDIPRSVIITAETFRPPLRVAGGGRAGLRGLVHRPACKSSELES